VGVNINRHFVKSKIDFKKVLQTFQRMYPIAFGLDLFPCFSPQMRYKVASSSLKFHVSLNNFEKIQKKIYSVYVSTVESLWLLNMRWHKMTYCILWWELVLSLASDPSDIEEPWWTCIVQTARFGVRVKCFKHWLKIKFSEFWNNLTTRTWYENPAKISIPMSLSFKN